METKKHSALRRQCGALPFRTTPSGEVEVLLITSRETRRWVIPKGWPMKKRSLAQSAAREAYEEAGVTGEISKKPLGSYVYEKRLKSRDVVPCEVDVFPLRVRRQADRWPEMRERDVRWFSPGEAAGLVDEAALGALILGLPHTIARRSGRAANGQTALLSGRSDSA